jgi:hypothetical protein
MSGPSAHAWKDQSRVGTRREGDTERGMVKDAPSQQHVGVAHGQFRCVGGEEDDQALEGVRHCARLVTPEVGLVVEGRSLRSMTLPYLEVVEP